MAYGKSNGQVLDDVVYASLLIRNWLHIDMPLPETIKLLENIEKQQIYNPRE